MSVAESNPAPQNNLPPLPDGKYTVEEIKPHADYHLELAREGLERVAAQAAKNSRRLIDDKAELDFVKKGHDERLDKIRRGTTS